ncbi:hypothetical protein Tco_0373663 [Tanacetum coccineum]
MLLEQLSIHTLRNLKRKLKKRGKSLENVVLAKSSSQPQSTYKAAVSLTEFELKKILLDKLEKSKSYRAAEDHRNLYDALVKSYQLDKDLFDSYVKAYSLKRSHEDKDKDDDPLVGPDQWLKKRKKSKDAKPPRSSKSKDSQSSSSKGTKSQPKSYSKSVQVEEPVFETADTKMPQDQGDDMGNTEDQPNVEAASKHDCKPLPLIEVKGRQVVPDDYFITNDLEYLKGGSLSRKYTTSTTKTKAAKSDISKLTPYTTYKNPQEIIYQDKLKSNRLMCSDKLYKFCDGTLTSVRRVLYDIASILEMDYLPKITWSKLDRKRSHIMIKAIDQQLFERRLMRNLEKFVGGREYGNDFRLLERTI